MIHTVAGEKKIINYGCIVAVARKVELSNTTNNK